MKGEQLAAQLQRKIASDLENDSLHIPNLPELAVKANELYQDPNLDVNALHQLVIQDPPIAAQLIRITNSPLLRRPETVTELTKALSLLGVQNALNLVISLTLSQLFKSSNPVLQTVMADIWRTSTDVAAYSYAIARHFTKLNADEAILAGLIHRIGAISVVSYADELEFTDAAEVKKIVNKTSPSIGFNILNKWHFPPELVEIPLQCCDFSRFVDKVDYSDVVQAARCFYLNAEGETIHLEDSESIRRIKIPLDTEFDKDEELNSYLSAARGLFA